MIASGCGGNRGRSVHQVGILGIAFTVNPASLSLVA